VADSKRSMQDVLYRALFETTPDGVLVVDDAGIYVEANESYCRMLKARREELIGRPFSDFIPPELLETSRQAFMKLKDGGPGLSEFPLLALDGTRVPLEWRARANILPGLHLCVARDIGERRRTEMELRQAKEAAEAASQAKDQFLATLSHELRTPLTPVLVLASSLTSNERLPPELRRSLDLIRRNVELEARLIDDLLDLTRITRGKLDLRLEVTDARKVIEHTIEICCEREVAAGHLRVVTELSPEDHRLWADPSRLTQVLWNLLNNAVKFTPVGGTVTVRSRRELEQLVIQVSDTGVGIDPETLPHVFDAFEQGRMRSPRRTGGLGLGLAISKAIAGMHGGTLTAASGGRGQGATFTLSMPSSLPKRTGEIPTVQISSTQNPKSKIQDLRILLVEDHADTAEAMADLLSFMGHRITTAGSVSEALSKVRAADGFDLVISDLGLPDGSGLDLMRELSTRHGLHGIALSGYGMEEDVRQSLEAGFRRHLTKPVSLPLLEAALREAAREGG
jgi:two-component system CheB/CheR fusion protein